MKIDSPLHAEHQLDQLAGQFEHWRQTRTHPYERFPHELWNHAVALASVLPPSRVAKQLRLRLQDLKKTDGDPSRSPPSALRGRFFHKVWRMHTFVPQTPPLLSPGSSCCLRQGHGRLTGLVLQRGHRGPRFRDNVALRQGI